jgi:LysR family hydrogen peroxide-inducible transcriptional activator
MAHPPTVKQLQYLVALHRTGHFGRAAEACHVSQPTLSAGLRELELLLDVALVERNRKIVAFTPVGEAVVEHARRLLAEADAIVALARGAGRPLAGPLTLGVIPTIAPFMLAAVLPRLRDQWPELKLFLREEQSGAACAALAQGQIEALLLALPYPCGEVDQAVLFSDPIRFAFHPADCAHPPVSIAPAAIDETRLLLLEDGHCLKEHALAACGRSALRPEAAMLGTSLHTLVQMVDNRIGCTLLPQMAIDAGILDRTSIITRPIDSPAASRAIALVWRARSPRSDEFRMLAGALQSAWLAGDRA